MIDKKLHAEMCKQWEKIHAPYQRWSRVETRMPLFLKYVDHFKGKNVVEFGCNAGIYGYEIAKVASYYIGVDQGECYIKQAQITEKYIEKHNATFFQRRVKGFIRDRQKAMERNEQVCQINAWFSSFTLYHLSDKETDLISEHILPKCDVVVIMTRTSKRSPWKKYNSRQLHKIKNVEAYLAESGFVCKSEMHKSGKFGITLAIKEGRDGGNQGEGGGDRKGKGGTPAGRGSQVRKRRESKRSKGVSAEREAALQGTDRLHVPAQEGVVPEDNVQTRPGEVISPEPKSGSEGVAEQKEAGVIRRNTEDPENSKSED